MARIHAEAAPLASAFLPVPHKRALRRWFSAAAAFLVMVTAAVVGSQVLTLEPGDNAAPAAVMGEPYLNKAAPQGTAENVHAYTASSDLPAPEAEAPAQAAPAEDLPETERGAPVTQRNADAAGKSTANSNGAVASTGGGLYSADDSAETNTNTEPDSAAPPAPDDVGESICASMKAAPELQLPPPESEAVSEGLARDLPDAADCQSPVLEAEAAEALLREHLALSSPDAATVTYKGLTPAGNAHLFLVTWPEGKVDAYSVDRIEGTVTPLPTPDSQSSPAP